MSVENISSKHGREFIKSLDGSGLIDDGPWEMNFSTVSAPNLIKPRNSILPNAPAIGRVSENNNKITRELLFGRRKPKIDSARQDHLNIC